MPGTGGTGRLPEFDLIWMRPEPVRQDQRPPLSREQIVRAAIELADEHGLKAVSARRIAGRLGSGATSLYWHVRSKADLYELMFDAMAGEVQLPEPTGDWRADLRAVARSTQVTYKHHPWIALLGIQPGLGPNTRRYAEFCMKILSRHGLGRQARTEVMAVLNNYLSGFASRQAAWGQLRQRAGLTDEQWEERLERYLAETRDRDPELAADIESRLHLTSDASFEAGLDCVIEGIAARFLRDGGGQG